MSECVHLDNSDHPYEPSGRAHASLHEHDGPPEYTPDDGEAQRIADTYADAAAELARDEAGEAGRG